MRTFKIILTAVTLVSISLGMGWALRECHSEQDCTTMFYAKGSQLECHK